MHDPNSDIKIITVHKCLVIKTNKQNKQNELWTCEKCMSQIKARKTSIVGQKKKTLI